MKRSVSLDPATLLSAYAQGAFPMADAHGIIQWYSADPRGVLPLDGFHVPGTLRALVRQRKFDVHINRDFAGTMRACMSVPREKEGGTWINEALIAAYVRLHEIGYAHSVEAWRDGQLAGGLYGVSLGGAFFGESMFHHVRDASKIALVHLVQRLRDRGFTLLDTQMTTSHLERFGAIEISADDYKRQLDSALAIECKFDG